MSSNMEAPGALSILELSSGEKEDLVEFLYLSRPDLNIDLLENIFKDKLLMILDAYAGQSIKFPTRVYLEKLVVYVKIYNFVKARGFTDDAYELASSVYKRKKVSIYRIVDKIKVILEKEHSNG